MGKFTIKSTRSILPRSALLKLKVGEAMVALVPMTVAARVNGVVESVSGSVLALGLTTKTARNYLDRVFSKLDVHTRTEAALVYTRWVEEQRGTF